MKKIAKSLLITAALTVVLSTSVSATEITIKESDSSIVKPLNGGTPIVTP
ncbi:hypothetical protein PQ478_08845 [Alkalihalophilus pseudofirmus]|nr:hypothetical protein [Alkalihalophilus pseudofirmus]WEG18577.1 hypothetical protein PQ478_08845 [Alkalihalophilus pseudofirmus]